MANIKFIEKYGVEIYKGRLKGWSNKRIARSLGIDWKLIVDIYSFIKKENLKI